MFSLLFHYSFFCWVFWIIFIFDERSTMSKKSSMPSVCRVFACHIFGLFLLVLNHFIMLIIMLKQHFVVGFISIWNKGVDLSCFRNILPCVRTFPFLECDLNTDLCSVYLPFQSNKGANKTRDQWMHKRDHHPIQCCFSTTRALSIHFRFNCHFYRRWRWRRIKQEATKMLRKYESKQILQCLHGREIVRCGSGYRTANCISFCGLAWHGCFVCVKHNSEWIEHTTTSHVYVEWMFCVQCMPLSPAPPSFIAPSLKTEQICHFDWIISNISVGMGIVFFFMRFF